MPCTCPASTCAAARPASRASPASTAIAAKPRCLISGLPPSSAHAGWVRREPSPDLWTDAWLAAPAQVHDCEIVTFDRGFRSYSRLKLRLLEPAG